MALDAAANAVKDVEGKLSAVGCDDAVLATQDGIVSLSFDRQAESLGSAVATAIDEIESTGCRVTAVHVYDRVSDPLDAELAAWEEASDQDFVAFERRME
ncbi:MAG TPA: hypothetical protein VNH11_08895 [Pirellulales bacterium]|nr:hypothetical protein [Pirellulales bacterium]